MPPLMSYSMPRPPAGRQLAEASLQCRDVGSSRRSSVLALVTNRQGCKEDVSIMTEQMGACRRAERVSEMKPKVRTSGGHSRREKAQGKSKLQYSGQPVRTLLSGDRGLSDDQSLSDRWGSRTQPTRE